MLWYVSLKLKWNANSPTQQHYTVAHCYQLYSRGYCCAYSVWCVVLWCSSCDFFSYLPSHCLHAQKGRVFFFFLLRLLVFQHFLHYGVPYFSISHNNHGIFHPPSTQPRPLCFVVLIYSICASTVQKYSFRLAKLDQASKTFLCAAEPSSMSTAPRLF